jgi:glutamate carboxypeptidase
MAVEDIRSIVSDLEGFISLHQREILDLTRQLIETESPSGDIEGSRSVVDLLVAEAEKLNSIQSIKRIEIPNYGEHLIISAWSNIDKSPILVLGHTDTVHPRGTIIARPWRKDNGRAYGPGIFDMKASCVMALYAIRACTELSFLPKHPVILLLTCDEENGSRTGRALVESVARRAKEVFVLEPPTANGSVKTGRKGIGIFRLDVHGIAAHAGLEPEKGASAILELVRQIDRLHSLNDASLGTTLNVGIVQGGISTNVVPAEAHAQIDVRFKTMEEGQRIEEYINNLVPFDERVKLSVHGGINRPPLKRTEDVIRLYERAKRIAAELGFDLGEAQVGGASDGNFVAAMGIPVLDGLGVMGDGAHADHEHIIVDSIAQRGALLSSLILGSDE